MNKRPPIIIVDNDDDLRSSLERVLRSEGQVVVAKREDGTCDSEGNRKISLEFPSDLTLLEPITNHITKRIEQVWSIPDGGCAGLALALRESLINAIKHGNDSDAAKTVRVTAEISNDQAKFTVEDQGPGFDVHDLPHPRDPENLFKSSGRGALLIKSIMDDVQYHGRGNRLTMIKKRASLFSDELLNQHPDDDRT
jgi:serine/threonine-protein kinase RsbW